MNFRINDYEITVTLAESSSTLVCRGHRLANGEPVVLKILKPDVFTKDELARFKHEFEITSRLDLPGVANALALEDNDESLAIVFRDIGGQSLDCLLRQAPLSLTDFLQLAVALADTVGLLHKQHIIHKDINPSNIIFNPATKQVNLFGFGFADDAPELNVNPRPPSVVEGTLAYISPEQTGRMNRPVDYRTDFYSLGITFYQASTGMLPFEAEDALGMVYCHIAKPPIPPRAINPDIPEMISGIVMKLLSKMADDRYQSGWGLKADLEKCLSELRNEGMIHRFELGEKDFSDQLRISRKLYGRQNETLRLLEAFDRAAAGGRELLLVAGYSGIGKTVLVHEINRPVAEKKGFFIEGKFDQLQRNVPYFAWLQALGSFVKNVLMEGEAQLAAWKESVLSAVGGAGRVLTDVIPNMELIIGTQPDVPALGPVEAQNRFNYVFLEFIKVVGTREHPLVVFLDDLQWIDSASLSLLRTLVSSSGVSNILLIGAYRNNEVDALHPLAMAIEALQKENAKIDLLTLGEIPEVTINELLADTLHYEQHLTVPLTHLIYLKIGGNPFFLLQTLRALVEKGTIYFDVKQRRWQWDISILNEMEITGNVIELMLGKINQLPSKTRNLMSLAACMGFKFDPSHLGIIAELPEDVTMKSLQPALREGMISTIDGGFQFVHDRIQQAAYSLIPDAEKKRSHLKIGRLLLEHIPEKDHEEQLFTVVDHLNVGAERLQWSDEKLELACLNLRAGLKAKASAAFSAADKYFEAGMTLLDEKSWENHFKLTLELHSQAAEAASLIGDYKKANNLFAVITQRALDPVDMVDVCRSRMMALSAQGRLPEFMDCSLESLDRLDVHIEPHPTVEDIRHLIEEFISTYDPNAIGALINLPRTDDRRELAISRILSLAQNSAYSGRPDLFALFAFESARRTIVYGYIPESMNAFCHVALVLLGLPFGNIELGYEFGMLAVALAERDSASSRAPAVMATTIGMISAFKQPLGETPEMLKPLFYRLKEVGDFEYAGYALCWYASNGLLSGRELENLEKEMAEHYKEMKLIRAEVACRWQSAFWQAAQNLMGRSRLPWILDGEAYNREATLRVVVETGNLAAQTALHVNTQILCYLFGRHDEALEASSLAEASQAGMVAMPIQPIWYFYDSLTRLALYAKASQAGKEALLERVATNQEYLAMRARHAPMNFLNKWHLVEAERARVFGDIGGAIQNYDCAVSHAKENGFIQEEALANELAGKFWLESGKEEFAQVHIRKACQGYAQWQAWAKVKALEVEYPHWLEEKNTEQPVITAQILDLSTMMKAMRAISSEIEMNKLLGEVMHIVIENAGAQRGYLLMEKDGKWVVSVKGETGKTEVEIPHPVDIEENTMVSPGVIHFVARTKKGIVLDDAANRGEFTRDPYIMHEKIRSLVCAPLLSVGRLIGILYLENNLTTHAFTPERIQLLEMFLSQAAISLENARIYEALRASEQKFHAIFEQTFQFIGLLSTDGIVLEANHAALQFAGVEEDAVLGKAFWDTPWWAHSSEMRHHLRKAVREAAGGKLVRFDATHAAPNGSMHYLDFSLKPITDSSGRVVQLIPEGRDITERKRAEAQEKIRLRIFELLAQGGDLTEILCYVVKYVDSADSDFIGNIMLTDAEGMYLHQTYSSGLPEDYLAAVKKVRIGEEVGSCGTAVWRGETVIAEDLRTHPFWAQYNRPALKAGLLSCWSEPIFGASGVVLGTISVYQRKLGKPTRENMELVRRACHLAAIAVERRRSLDALRESEARYRSLFEESIDCVFVSSVEGKIIDINQAGVRMFGYDTKEEMTGLDLAREVYANFEDRNQLLPVIDQKGSGEYEVVLKKKNGETMLVHCSMAVVRNRGGNVTGYQGVLRDITEERRLEQELFKAKKMEIIGQLAGGVAHEVRNPLNAILSISEALFREKEIAENPEFFPYVQHIRTQVGRLSKLMTDLLDLGKPIRPGSIQSVPLNEVVTVTSNLWSLMEGAATHPMVFTCDDMSRGLVVNADSVRLQQALLNLLENASQHSPAGSEINLHIGRPVGQRVTLQVRDSGKGIVPEKLGKVFDPFFTSRAGGTGLGLPLVKHFVESMGGEVKIRNNEPPPGCTAEVILRMEAREAKVDGAVDAEYTGMGNELEETRDEDEQR